MGNSEGDAGIDATGRNLARYFAENRQVGWILLVGVVIWGIASYYAMPQRKDPEIQIRTAVALTPWPGSPSADVEELVTQSPSGKPD